MPQEDRRLVFDYEEIYKAIYALCTQREMRQLPPGVIIDVSVDEKNADVIWLRIMNPQEKMPETTELTYTRDFLAAAMMLYCRGQGIPLPKKAQKSVMINQKSVILRILL